MVKVEFKKFELRAPSQQNAVDIFSGRWASDLSKVCSVSGSGISDLFVGDPRPKMAAEALGTKNGRLDGMRILELGPLEAGHSFQMERLGAASVMGIEANAEAFLKCLVVKELFNLTKCHFMLGDVVEFTMQTAERFDMIFCSGLLYHMKDPVALIKSICNLTDRCFIWTHYYNDESGNREGARKQRDISYDGFDTTYYELEYLEMQEGNFWGGNTSTRAWMLQDALLSCFKHFGLSQVTVLQDTPAHPHGAAMSFVASR